MNITQLLRNHTQLPSKYCSVVLETTFLLDTVVIINVCQVMNLPSSFFWSRQEILNRLQEHYYKFLVQIYKIVGYKHYNSNILGNGSEKPITDFLFFFYTVPAYKQPLPPVTIFLWPSASRVIKFSFPKYYTRLT